MAGTIVADSSVVGGPRATGAVAGAGIETAANGVGRSRGVTTGGSQCEMSGSREVTTLAGLRIMSMGHTTDCHRFCLPSLAMVKARAPQWVATHGAKLKSSASKSSSADSSDSAPSKDPTTTVGAATDGRAAAAAGAGTRSALMVVGAGSASACMRCCANFGGNTASVMNVSSNVSDGGGGAALLSFGGGGGDSAGSGGGAALLSFGGGGGESEASVGSGGGAAFCFGGGGGESEASAGSGGSAAFCFGGGGGGSASSSSNEKSSMGTTAAFAAVTATGAGTGFVAINAGAAAAAAGGCRKPATDAEHHTASTTQGSAANEAARVACATARRKGQAGDRASRRKGVVVEVEVIDDVKLWRLRRSSRSGRGALDGDGRRPLGRRERRPLVGVCCTLENGCCGRPLGLRDLLRFLPSRP